MSHHERTFAPVPVFPVESRFLRTVLTTVATGVGLAFLGAFPGSVHADDCFMLVHGQGPDGTQGTTALDYWERSFISGRTPGSFLQTLAQGGAHYGIVGWNGSPAAALPYWHPETVGTVAQQMLAIVDGQGDGYAHGQANSQCAATDTFYVITYSQSAQLLTYMSGNAYPGAPYEDLAIDALSPADIDGTEATVPVPFTAALAQVDAIYTLSGSVNGTQAMDLVCDGGLAGLIGGLFSGCVESLQTYDQFNPSSYTGATLATPIYAIGAHKSLPLPYGVTSLLLGGEDDGAINLASQMNCQGSPKRDLEKDLVEYNWFGWPTFRCDDDHKRHANHFNLASILTDHDAIRNASYGTREHIADAEDVLGCGQNENAANTILACVP